MLQNLYSDIYQKQFISHNMEDKYKNMALDEADKMLVKPMNQLPSPAVDYLKHLSGSIGICIEVCFTAYCYYNQAVKNMPCDDEQYKITPEAQQWFIDNGHVIELTCMECGDTWMGGEPARCCSGKDCGCMGQPIDPVVCSGKCYDKVINKYK